MSILSDGKIITVQLDNEATDLNLTELASISPELTQGLMAGGSNVSQITSSSNSLSESSSTTNVQGNSVIQNAMFSSGYVKGITGWRVTGLGDAEFNKGTFRGELKAASGTFKGSLVAASGTFSGSLIAASGTFTGALVGATGTFSGAIIAGSIDIPNKTNTNSFHVNSSGDAWWGSSAIGTSKARVFKDGLAEFQQINILGGDISDATKIASDSYNFTAGLVAPNALSAKNMGFPIAFGDGRDGDLTVSGTTQIDETKQYNNLTIENGGVLTSNLQKTLFVAVKGTLTINSGGKISMVGKGSAGGLYSATDSLRKGENGSGSGAGVDYLDFTTRQGASGGGAVGYVNFGQFAGAGGDGYNSGGAAFNAIGSGNAGNGASVPQIIKNRAVLNPSILLNMWGAGGGASYNATTNGGNGGGVIYIECYNLVINENTTALDASGEPGIYFPSYPSGGGAGGCVFIRYHIISNINNSNTNIKVSGGAGIDGGSGRISGSGGDGLVFLQEI